jgi:hypothetical protein
MEVTVERVIARARPEVAAFVMDHRNDPRWIGGITSSELAGEPPIREGSEVRRLARFLGRDVDYVLRVERLEPDALLAMRSVRAPFPMTVAYRFADAREGTRVSIDIGGDPSRWYALAGPLLAAQARRSIAADLGRLAALLEGPATTGL